MPNLMALMGRVEDNSGLSKTLHCMLRRQQEGKGGMFWEGITGSELVGPFRVPDGVKINLVTYVEFLKKMSFHSIEKNDEAFKRN